MTDPGPGGPVPAFAVVGRTNKGKSSVIATLAEDDSVRIGRRPGTTTEVRRYPVSVDGRVLFELYDTPGFEEATRALAWLRARETTAADRAALVRQLVEAHEGTDELVEERRLLRPILDGASVLYVVDASHPYRPNYEAEMEILRWTGQPGMALVNRVGADDHAAAWRRALDQYFRIVRDFDAWAVTFDERVALLEAFRELRPAWRGAIDAAIGALRGERDRRRAEAARVVTELLVDALTLTLEVVLDEGASPRDEARRLEERFHDALRAREARARRSLEHLYGHDRVRWQVEDLPRPAFDQDLFAERTWKDFGLTPAQTVAAWAAAGATTGGTVDALVGGASLMAGAVLGGIAGAGVGVWQLGRRFARAASVRGALEDLRRAGGGGRRFVVGPHAHVNFPWVLLDRALRHVDAVRTRAHARQDVPVLAAAPDLSPRVADLPRATRDELAGLFAAVRKSHADVPRDLRDELEGRIAALLEAPPAAG